jgi:UDP-N-acetylmuramoylalanine--D-glutamate ligase
MQKRCKKVIFLEGTGTERLKKEMPDVAVYENLKAAYGAARSAASAGDTILFSPAFASFGMFQNEYDRNDQFLKLVGEA